jgi:uncharacterized membrane protein affecting hemolysin expression
VNQVAGHQKLQQEQQVMALAQVLIHQYLAELLDPHH